MVTTFGTVVLLLVVPVVVVVVLAVSNCWTFCRADDIAEHLVAELSLLDYATNDTK